MTLFDSTDTIRDQLDQAFRLMNIASPLFTTPTAGDRTTTKGIVSTKRGMNLNIAELSDSYRIIAELAGVSKEDINISLEEGVLTIKGDKKKPEWYPSNPDNILLEEGSYGKVQRNIRLPNDIDPEACSAHFESGILVLELQKLKQARARTIEIGSRDVTRETDRSKEPTLQGGEVGGEGAAEFKQGETKESKTSAGGADVGMSQGSKQPQGAQTIVGQVEGQLGTTQPQRQPGESEAMKSGGQGEQAGGVQSETTQQMAGTEQRSQPSSQRETGSSGGQGGLSGIIGNILGTGGSTQEEVDRYRQY